MLLTFLITSGQLNKAGAKLKTLRRRAGAQAKGEAGSQAEAQPNGEAGSQAASSADTTTIIFGTILAIIFIAIVGLYLVGLCTIFNRSNPDLSGGVKTLAYVLLALQLLFVGDIYIIYFVVRMGIQGIQGTSEYKTLPFPAPFFKPKHASPSPNM
jgi:hypothetical protein